MEGTQREVEQRREQWEGGGEEEQLGCHSCVEVLVTLGFKQCSAGGGDALAKQQNNIRPCCCISIGLEMND